MIRYTRKMNKKKARRLMPSNENARRLMSSKKGFLLGDFALKLIVAVICIGLLIYLGVVVERALTIDEQLQKAKESINLISNAVEQAENSGSFKVLLLGPKDWNIIIYHVGKEETPDKCEVGKGSCVCICLENSVAGCNKRGVCKSFDADVEFVITGTFTDNFIVLRESSINIFSKKQEEKIIIYTKEEEGTALDVLSNYLNKEVSTEIDGQAKKIKISELIILSEKMSQQELEKGILIRTREILDPILGEGKWAINICYPAVGEHTDRCWLFLNFTPWLQAGFGPDVKASVNLKIPYEKGEIEVRLKLIK